MVDRLLRAFLVIGGVSAACAWTWPGAFPEADPLAVLVRYHTPNFYRAAVAWYYVDHGASLCALSAGFIFLTFISTCTCDRLRQSRSCLILLVVLLAAQFATATTRSGTAQGARHRQRHHPRTDGRGAPHRSTYRRRHARRRRTHAGRQTVRTEAAAYTTVRLDLDPAGDGIDTGGRLRRYVYLAGGEHLNATLFSDRVRRSHPRVSVLPALSVSTARRRGTTGAAGQMGRPRSSRFSSTSRWAKRAAAPVRTSCGRSTPDQGTA